MFKAVIFDCDGTLVDTEEAHYQGWQHAMQRFGIKLAIEDLPHYVGRSTETNAQTLAELVGRDCARELITEKSAYYHKLQQRGLPLIQGTVDFVHRLAKERSRWGLKLGVASAANRHEILVNLKTAGIDHLFDVVLSGVEDLGGYNDPEGTNKPKPYIYLHAAKMLGVNPLECIVVEDSTTGVQASVSAGCLTIAVPNAFSRFQDLSQAHHVLESFSALTVADFLQQLQ